MKLKTFIENLKKIENGKGGDLEVIMADGIPVIKPVFSNQYGDEKVVITDEK